MPLRYDKGNARLVLTMLDINVGWLNILVCMSKVFVKLPYNLVRYNCTNGNIMIYRYSHLSPNKTHSNLFC
jgi:hypothetical protein